MKTPLRALIVEDRKDDAELVLRELRRAYDVHHRWVMTAEDMRKALGEESWDIILSDYSLPSFDAMRALEVRKQSGLDIPFILVSGTIGEETAVEALKAGANDFMVKGRLARLLPAVERELREAKIRRERLDAVRRVEQSERRMKAIFSQVAVGVVETDLLGRILRVNKRFCDLVARGEEALVGTSFAAIMHPEDAPFALQVFDDINRGGRSHLIELRCRRDDGSVVLLSTTLSVVAGAGGEPELTVAVVQDITDKRRAEDALRDAVRARDEFLSIASHELKTPVTSLHPQVIRLRRLTREGRFGDPPPERLEWRLGVIARQVERLTLLTDNLLDVTRITAGRMRFAPQTVDLREVALSAGARHHDAIEASGSTFVLSAPRPVVGSWDPTSLETVIGNLLSNAAKFGGGTPIQVQVDSDGASARIVVKDGGIGIPPEAQERIFQQFERAVQHEHYGGFGLGLWIVRQVVEAHGGTIRVASAPGAGSTFTIELPLQREQARAEP